MHARIQLALFVLCSLALFQQGLGWLRAPSTGLRLPRRWHMIKYSTYVNKVSGRTWSEIYNIPPDPSFPDQLRFTIFPVVDGNNVYIPYQFSYNGVCMTESNSTYVTNFTNPTNTKYAIPQSGATELRYFSSNLDNYLFALLCIDTTAVVHGVCSVGYLSLMVPQFPPIQLDWWGIIWDLRRVMGLELTDPRFQFSAGADLPCN